MSSKQEMNPKKRKQEHPPKSAGKDKSVKKGKKRAPKEELSSSSESEQELDFTKDKKHYAKLNKETEEEEQPYKPVGGDPDDEEDMEDEDFDLVECEFELCDPDEKHFHSVKHLLGGLLDGKTFQLSELADTVCNQGNVGTMIRADDQESDSTIALVTALSLNQYKDLKCMAEIKEHLLEHCPPEHKDKLTQLLADKKSNVGLLLNERVVNLPPQLVPPTHKALAEDIEWSIQASDEDVPPEERPFYKFTHFLAVTKYYRDPSAASSSGASSSGAAAAAGGEGKKKKNKKTDEFDGAVYAKFEDELYLQHAEFQFSWPTNLTNRIGGVSTKNSEYKEAPQAYPEYRLVYVVPYKALPVIAQQLAAMADDAE